MNMFEDLKDVFDIEFVGGRRMFGVRIVDILWDPDARPIVLIDQEGWMYNWTTIIRMKKVVL